MNVLLNGGKAKLIGQRPATSQRPKKRSKGEQLPDDRTYNPAFLLHGVSSQNAAEKGSSAWLRSIAPRQGTVQAVQHVQTVQNVEKHKHAPTKRWISGRWSMGVMH